MMKEKIKKSLNYLKKENKYTENWFKKNKVNQKKYLNIIKIHFQNLKKVLNKN